MRFVLAIDYDGTLFEGTWNSHGNPIMPVILQTKRFCDHHSCDVILWSCREESLLVEAVDRCEEYGIRFAAVNVNSQQAMDWNLRQFGRHGITAGRKIFADLYVDDKSPGSIDHFLTLDPDVEWKKIALRNT